MKKEHENQLIELMCNINNTLTKLQSKEYVYDPTHTLSLERMRIRHMELECDILSKRCSSQADHIRRLEEKIVALRKGDVVALWVGELLEETSTMILKPFSGGKLFCIWCSQNEGDGEAYGVDEFKYLNRIV